MLCAVCVVGCRSLSCKHLRVTVTVQRWMIKAICTFGGMAHTANSAANTKMMRTFHLVFISCNCSNFCVMSLCVTCFAVICQKSYQSKPYSQAGPAVPHTFPIEYLMDRHPQLFSELTVLVANKRSKSHNPLHNHQQQLQQHQQPRLRALVVNPSQQVAIG